MSVYENKIEEEYLFIVAGIQLSMYSHAVALRSSNLEIGSLSCILNDNVFPPYLSHKLIREDVIKIRDFLNEYLHRTSKDNE